MPDTLGSAAAARLRVAAAALLDEAERQPRPLIYWKPDAGVWSIIEILSHVREFVPYWTGQALQVVRHPDQPWGRDHRDPDRLAAVESGAALELADVAAAIREVVHASAETIHSLSDEALSAEAASRNPRWQRKPASFIVDHLVVEHVEKHLGQVRRNVEQHRQRGTAAQ